jgi:hypothetical protein
MVLGLLRLSPLAAKITFKPAPDRRPSSVGPAVASVLAFLNLDRLPVTIGEFTRAHERTRQSRLSKAIAAHVKGEVLGQALAVLASVNHLGNVAGTLDQFGNKIRELGDKFDSSDGGGDGDGGGGGRGEGSALGDLAGGHVNVVTGIAVGGGELAKGLLGGVSGIFSKAATGFQKSGLHGFATGAAQGVVGAATSTAAGAVGFAARVVEGIDATVGAAQDGVKGGADAAAARRLRLPLAVRGDGVVRPYSRDDAEGLHLLRTASVRDSFGARRRPFAGGRFEDALHVADGRVLLLSHRHCGVVVAGEERTEWVMAWAQVASLRLGPIDGGQERGVANTLIIQARGGGNDGGAAGVGGAGSAINFISGGLARGGGNLADMDSTKQFVRCQSR